MRESGRRKERILYKVRRMHLYSTEIDQMLFERTVNVLLENDRERTEESVLEGTERAWVSLDDEPTILVGTNADND